MPYIDHAAASAFIRWVRGENAQPGGAASQPASSRAIHPANIADHV
jgi:hypothetical protein